METEEDLDPTLMGTRVWHKKQTKLPTLMMLVYSPIFFAYKTLVKMKSFVGGQHGYQKPIIQILKCDSYMLELAIIFEYVYLKV